MKKILVLIITLLLMVGCGSSSKLSENDLVQLIDNVVKKSESIKNSKSSFSVDLNIELNKEKMHIKGDFETLMQSEPSELYRFNMNMNIDGLNNEMSAGLKDFKMSLYMLPNPDKKGSWIVVNETNNSFTKTEVAEDVHEQQKSFNQQFLTASEVKSALVKNHKFTKDSEVINGHKTSLLEFNVTKDLLKTLFKSISSSVNKDMSTMEIPSFESAVESLNLDKYAVYKVYVDENYLIRKTVIDFTPLADAFKVFVKIDKPVLEVLTEYDNVKIELPANFPVK